MIEVEVEIEADVELPSAVHEVARGKCLCVLLPRKDHMYVLVLIEQRKLIPRDT